MSIVHYRTKWKRQASVGIELLTEAGNLAAIQSICARLPWMPPPPPPPLPTFPSSTAATSLGTSMDFYYRHALATFRPPFVSSPPRNYSGLEAILDPILQDRQRKATESALEDRLSTTGGGEDES